LFVFTAEYSRRGKHVKTGHQDCIPVEIICDAPGCIAMHPGIIYPVRFWLIFGEVVAAFTGYPSEMP